MQLEQRINFRCTKSWCGQYSAVWLMIINWHLVSVNKWSQITQSCWSKCSSLKEKTESTSSHLCIRQYGSKNRIKAETLSHAGRCHRSDWALSQRMRMCWCTVCRYRTRAGQIIESRRLRQVDTCVGLRCCWSLDLERLSLDWDGQK